LACRLHQNNSINHPLEAIMVIIKGLVAAAIAGLGALAVYSADASPTTPEAQRCPDIGLVTLFAPMRNY
jgi:hypothetical protein